MAPPLTQPCAYGGYGASRLRAGEANQCKASKSIAGRSKGWEFAATVRDRVSGLLAGCFTLHTPALQGWEKRSMAAQNRLLSSPTPLRRCLSVRVATACCGGSSKQAGRQRRPTVHWRGDIGGLLQVLRALLRPVAVGATPSPRLRPSLFPPPLPRYLSFCQSRAACALLLA